MPKPSKKRIQKVKRQFPSYWRNDKRDMIYNHLFLVMKEHRGAEQDDKLFALRMISHKIHEGEL